MTQSEFFEESDIFRDTVVTARSVAELELVTAAANEIAALWVYMEERLQ